MSRQEEIREGTVEVYCQLHGLEYAPSEDTDKAYRDIDLIFRYLDSQGVVVKVKKELPVEKNVWRRTCYNYCQEDMLKAGFEAVEPLIKKTGWLTNKRGDDYHEGRLNKDCHALSIK